jgi:prepilin-type N-terminal cleavage/methylation domain-containing protein
LHPGHAAGIASACPTYMRAKRILPRHRLHHAFTLVEVSVVIVCLAVLAVLILPMFAKAKVHPLWTRRTYHPKNVGLAAWIFATGNEGLYPWQLSVTNGGTKGSPGTRWHVAPHFQALSNG